MLGRGRDASCPAPPAVWIYLRRAQPKGGEFPIAPFRLCGGFLVPPQAHVSAGPPVSSRTVRFPESGWRPWLSPARLPRCRRRLSAGPHTPLTVSVYSLARHTVDHAVVTRALRPATRPSDARHVPRAPLPHRGVTPSGVTFPAT